MGMMFAILAGVGAIAGAALAKVIADDAKEWTPWVTRRLLDRAVRILPESQRERYAEEWAAHLAEVPGVVAKLALSLQFQIAAVWARELEAKARVDAWRNEADVLMAELRDVVNESFPLAEVSGSTDNEANANVRGKIPKAVTEALGRADEVLTRCPALGITAAFVRYDGVEFLLDYARDKPLIKACRPRRVLRRPKP
jgi:hypothetical protein